MELNLEMFVLFSNFVYYLVLIFFVEMEEDKICVLSLIFIEFVGKKLLLVLIDGSWCEVKCIFCKFLYFVLLFLVLVELECLL